MPLRRLSVGHARNVTPCQPLPGLAFTPAEGLVFSMGNTAERKKAVEDSKVFYGLHFNYLALHFGLSANTYW